MKKSIVFLLALMLSGSAFAGQNLFVKQDKSNGCALIFAIKEAKDATGVYKKVREPSAEEAIFENETRSWKESGITSFKPSKASLSYVLFSNPKVDFDSRSVSLDVELKLYSSGNLKKRVTIKDDNKQLNEIMDKLNRRMVSLSSGVCIDSSNVLHYVK